MGYATKTLGKEGIRLWTISAGTNSTAKELLQDQVQVLWYFYRFNIKYICIQ